MVAVDFRDVLARARKQKQKTGTAQLDVSRALALLKHRAEDRSVPSPQTLAAKRLQGLSYCSSFISPQEEAALLTCIRASVERPWTKASGRRIQNWGGEPGRAEAEALPEFLQTLVHRLVAAGVYAPEVAPNHCLINEYTGGSGIPAHDDGPLYVPPVATISLGGSVVINFITHSGDGDQPLITKVLLQQGCLLVVDGAAYKDSMHEILAQEADVIDNHCCNAALLNVAEGDVIKRPQCRHSLVFVHKRAS
ncbi:hypothetical protein WJX74_002001 [Apatococcus lobatus]|uniref:Fe2OG dioxygenase domain-containing protein n=2 Tax=Apatococcus TaxID=904362 RepID=A0AAW1SSD2_9CHLO